MFRSAPRLIARPGLSTSTLRTALPTRRCISTAPPAQKSRSWKSLAARLGLAGGVVYYYNTSDLFSEEAHRAPRVVAPVDAEPEAVTLEAIAAERAQRREVQRLLELQRQQEVEAEKAAEAATPQTPSEAQGGVEGLQAEADQQGAFNPETGEINWDCPCLGGMATGPCGDEFKAAFSCFVYSKEEPKGMDCIDKFKDMQNCFRQYPEIYGSEIDNDDDEDDMTADAADVAPAKETSSSSPSTTTNAPTSTPPPTQQQQKPKSKSTAPAPSGPHSPEKVAENRRELGLVPEHYRPEEKEAKKQEPVSESESLVPKAAHDGR